MSARSFALLGGFLVVAAAAVGAAGFGPQGLPSHTLTGRVTDTDGQPLAGTTVELSLPASTGSVGTMVTGRDGTYRFERVVPGAYVLTARLAGFSIAIRDLDIGGGDAEFRFDFQLNPWFADDTGQVPSPAGPQRRVVCGLTMITPPNADPKMFAPALPQPPATPYSDRLIPGAPPKSPDLPRLPVKPTMRTVQPTICWDPTPNSR
jgi:hypothetical protein